jgi:hypothetical protein
MRQALAVTLTLCLSYSASLFERPTIQHEAKLVHRYEERCGYSCAQELAIDLGGIYGKSPDDKIAVRFCSKDPMPVALTTSAAAYGYVVSILEGSYGYTPERVLFLRSEDCLGPNRDVTATEFWVIPKGTTMPSSVDLIKSSQVQMDSLGVQGLTKSARTYKAALQKLRTKLRARPGAVGVIIGYYYNRPSLAIKRRIREARKVLEQSGLGRDRYFTRITPWTGERQVAPPPAEPKYPGLFVVEVARDSAGYMPGR